MDINLKNISKKYEDKQVIKDLNLEMKSGDILSIMGGSGIGKTTVMNIILGIEKADSGVLTLGGKESISAVFQEDRLAMGFSAIKNIEIVCPNLPVAEIEKELKAVGLSQQDIIKPVSKLSGGMQRRVAILRAIIYNSGAILMDEPFKGLDIDTKTTVINYLLKKLKGRTLVVITHDLTEAQILGGKIFNM